MKVIKVFFKVVLALVLIAVLGAVFVLGFYFPKYWAYSEKLVANDLPNDGKITVVSANVRCFAPQDLFKKSWFYRAPLLLQTLQDAQPDIIGFQEVTPLHKKFFDRTLRCYDYTQLYRDDTLLKESCPIYFNELKFDLVDKGGFWLSETPNEMSKDWGAACYRVCSYVILTQKSDGKQLVVFNTHLDNASELARINGIRLVLQKIEQFGGIPSVIMGDLNAEENTETYKAATALFLDAKYQTDDTDSGATYQFYGQALDDENIDYFLISKTGIDVLQYKVLRTTYDDVYPSDHFPIRMEMKLS